jgi:VWFA-related protein
VFGGVTVVGPLVSAFACATIFAQCPAASAPQEPSPNTIIRVDVNLVQIDAVVTDSHGKPVADLKAGDFQILQDGKAQNIRNFAYISTGAVAGAPAPTPPTALKPSQVRRAIALVVDDLGLSFESVARVRNSLRKFVGQQMRPGDLVAIIRTGAGMGALQTVHLR